MKQIIDVVNQTIVQSSLKNFQNYLRNFNNCTKWMLCSDYSLGNPLKRNDSLVFTFIPYVFPFQEYNNLINCHLPVDIKKTKYTTKDKIRLLSSGLFFSFGFILEKKRTLLKNVKTETEKEKIIIFIEMWHKILQNSDNPNLEILSKKVSSQFDELSKYLSRKNADIKLIKDILLTSTLSAYFLGLILKEHSRVETLGWFSDQDKMIDFKNNIIFTLSSLLYSGVCSRFSINAKRVPKLSFGLNLNKKGATFFDKFVRIPDHVAGALADWNVEKNTVTHKKFLPIIDHCLSKANISSINRLKLKTGEYNCSRLEIIKTNS